MALDFYSYISGQYLENVTILFESFSFESKSFWTLFISGQWNPGAGTWYEMFSKLYILHLMVMSGTQVGALDTVVRKAFWFVVPYRYHLRVHPVEKYIRSFFLLNFVIVSGVSPPILRGALVTGLRVAMPRLIPSYALVAALLIQTLFFSSHLMSLGFYLSWLAFLILFISRELKLKSYLLSVVVSSVIFVLVEVFVFDNALSFQMLMLCVLANVIFCDFFEYALVPLAGWMIFVSIVSAYLLFFCHILGPIGKFLALWGDPLVKLLLVAIKKLMYTNLL